MPKDACYKKVKARYKVFPSAYASGAIAKCRKVGASNWGESSKKRKRKVKKKLREGGFIAFGVARLQKTDAKRQELSDGCS